MLLFLEIPGMTFRHPRADIETDSYSADLEGAIRRAITREDRADQETPKVGIGRTRQLTSVRILIGYQGLRI